MSSPGPNQHPHAPAPSLWPVGFAVGIAILLTSVVIGAWIVVAIGAALTLFFGFLWARDVMSGAAAAHGPEAEPAETGVGAAPVVPGAPPESALPPAAEAETDRFPRSRFLEATTLGLGGVIGGIVTLPVAGFALIPTFVGKDQDPRDVGAVDDFPENEWRVVTFMTDPAEGEVSRRTVFIRNNGLLGDRPSFTVISNSCVHLGCPVQPSGPLDEQAAQEEETANTVVTRIPSNPAAFACPCHGGAYDTEGNRTAGPPVRALDRYEFGIVDGRLVLGKPFSVGKVEGEGREAVFTKYDHFKPGIHVDGPEQIFYPINAPEL